VDEQALGVRRCPPDARILQLPLEVQVPVELVILRFRSRKTASCSLERDRRLCN
jgi:hypothetical protein